MPQRSCNLASPRPRHHYTLLIQIDDCCQNDPFYSSRRRSTQRVAIALLGELHGATRCGVPRHGIVQGALRLYHEHYK